MPLVMLQARVSLKQAPLSTWKLALQLVGAQVPQVVAPALQL